MSVSPPSSTRVARRSQSMYPMGGVLGVLMCFEATIATLAFGGLCFLTYMVTALLGWPHGPTHRDYLLMNQFWVMTFCVACVLAVLIVQPCLETRNRLHMLRCEIAKSVFATVAFGYALAALFGAERFGADSIWLLVMILVSILFFYIALAVTIWHWYKDGSPAVDEARGSSTHTESSPLLPSDSNA